MTGKTDIQTNREALEIAHRAMDWVDKFPTIGAMEGHQDGFALIDRPEFPYIAVVQFESDNEVKFGHIIMREGKHPHAKAGAMDVYHPDGTVTWVILGYSPHTEDRTLQLAQHLKMDSLVHEATHVIDGLRTAWRGARFSEAQMSNLSKYYCSPHEFNAHFHQGLFLFLNDLDRIRFSYQQISFQSSGRIAIIERALIEYWSGHFLGHLNRKYARKMRKRLWKVIDAMGLDSPRNKMAR